MKNLLAVVLLGLIPQVCFEQAQAPAPLVVPYQYNIPITSPGCCVGYGVPYIETLSLSPSQFQVPVVAGAISWNTPPYGYEGVYTLTFDVQNFFPAYPGWYDVEIYFGTQKLCEVAGWGRRAVQTVSVPCGSPGYIIIDQTLGIDPGAISGGSAHVQSVEPFQITYSVPGWQLAITNVQFTWAQDR